MFSQACVILFTISLMATGSLLILVMAQSVASYCNDFLFGILFGENCMDLKKNGQRGRMSFATVNLSFQQKLSVRNCYQSPQPPGCSFLAVLEGRKGYKLLTKNCYYQLLPPSNEVWEGYVFTGVYLSTGRGVSAPLHAGIHIIQDQRQTPPWDQTPPEQTPLADTPRATSGRYASYWNAYLFV